MELVKDVKMSVRIETDKRTVEKEFGNVHELRWFMDNFFSSVPERRPSKKLVRHIGRGRLMPS